MVVPIRKQMEDIEAQIADMERSIALIAGHVKKQLAAAPAHPANLEEQLAAVKAATQRIAAVETAVRAITPTVKQQLEATKRELAEFVNKQQNPHLDSPGVRALESRLTDEIARVEAFVSDTAKVTADDLRHDAAGDIARLEDLIHSSKLVLTQKGMDDYLDKISKIKTNLERYVNVKVQLLETRIQELAHAVKTSEESATLAAQEAVAAEAREVTAKITALETKLGEGIAKLEKQITGHSFEDTQLNLIKERFAANVASVEAELLEKITTSETTLEQEIAAFRQSLDSHEFRAVQHELQAVKTEIESMTAEKQSMQKSIDDLEQMVASFNVREELESVKQALEHEGVSRLSLEKNVDDLEHTVAQMRSSMQSLHGLEAKDFDKLAAELEAFKAQLRDAEHDTHLKTMNLITQQLEEFAKTLDKRLPEIVTRGEFAESLGVFRAKIRSIQSPDLTPLALRVERLERDIDRVLRLMEDMYSRLPIVVE